MNFSTLDQGKILYSGQKKKVNGSGDGNEIFPVRGGPFLHMVFPMMKNSDHNTMVPKRIYSLQLGENILHLPDC